MELPPIDRTPPPRPVSVELASIPTTKVVPVAAVNPGAAANASIQPTPSVINLIGQSGKSNTGEGVYTSVSDPGRRGSEAATANKDWTIHRPKPDKVEDPPPVPLSQMLIEHVKSLWIASASAVQVQQQVKNQLEALPLNPSAGSGALATESITYSPGKINKAQNI